MVHLTVSTDGFASRPDGKLAECHEVKDLNTARFYAEGGDRVVSRIQLTDNQAFVLLTDLAAQLRARGIDI